jgi:hypothetical protein
LAPGLNVNETWHVAFTETAPAQVLDWIKKSLAFPPVTWTPPIIIGLGPLLVSTTVSLVLVVFTVTPPNFSFVGDRDTIEGEGLEVGVAVGVRVGVEVAVAVAVCVAMAV